MRWRSRPAPRRIRSLAYLRGGELLASAGEGRKVSLWNAASGELQQTLDCKSGKVLSMAACGNDLIATGGSDNLVRVWNWRSQSEAERLRGHTGSVATLAYDAASDTVVSGSFDTTLRVWALGRPATPEQTAEGAPKGQRVR